jgi:hypothetical protein
MQEPRKGRLTAGLLSLSGPDRRRGCTTQPPSNRGSPDGPFDWPGRVPWRTRRPSHRNPLSPTRRAVPSKRPRKTRSRDCVLILPSPSAASPGTIRPLQALRRGGNSYASLQKQIPNPLDAQLSGYLITQGPCPKLLMTNARELRTFQVEGLAFRERICFSRRIRLKQLTEYNSLHIQRICTKRSKESKAYASADASVS